MDIFLSNTLGGKKELFTPIVPGKVGIYSCGPTVYDYAHIGNMRAYVFADILRRTFEFNGYEVNHVINITDIGHLTSDADEGEDKMTKALTKAGKALTLESLKEHADLYAEKFEEDLKKLNIKTPSHLPKASAHIQEDIDLIVRLEKKGFAYKITNGIYFDTSKDSEYGKLGGINRDAAEDQSRIGLDAEKRNPQDFCLWKLDENLGWESPWGKGFPGWHIECSAMSMKYLGETFDIHTGGVDHIPVHHNNEIAQSESATGKPLAHYWMHSSFINLNNDRIAKSTGNTLYVKDLLDKGIQPISYRYLLLTGHYSTPMNFTWEALEAADTALNRLMGHLAELAEGSSTANEEYKNLFQKHLNNDLDTPKALALIWELLKDTSIDSASKRATIVDFDKVLQLNLDEGAKALKSFSPEASRLKEERDQAKKDGDYAKADEIRTKIENLGYEVLDTKNGTQLRYLPGKKLSS